MNERPSTTEPDALRDALAAVWRQRRRAMLERLAVIERAAAAGSTGDLDEGLRAAAEREAHKLAGSLGSFGRPEGSRLAARAERAVAGAHDGTGFDGGALGLLLRELRHELREDDRPGTHPAPADLLVVHSAPTRLAPLVEASLPMHGLACRSVTTVADARTAVAAIPPDVVLVDAGLPDSTALVAELTGRAPPIPVLALSAPRGLVDRLAMVEAGALGILDHAVTADHLADVVDTALDRVQDLSGSVVLAIPPGAPRDTVAVAFGDLGLEVRTVDGARALQDLLEYELPDLLLLEDLPDATSLGLARALRGDDRLDPVTVVVVATDPDHAFLRAAAEAGADAVLAHPLDLPSLRARTVRVLQRTRAIRAAVEADRLTGLVNRRRLDAELLRYAVLADRFDQRLTLTLVDLDRFKRVNDTYGHPTGDEVLRRVAAVLRETFRGEDVVARWGGEEIAIATFGMGAQDSVRRVEGALQAVREHRFSAPDDSEFRVTFSAGVAEYGRDAADVAGLYAAADQALYLAKATGRDRVVAAGSQDLAPPGIVDVAIVDDDEVLTDLLQRALDEHQLTHVTFSNGRRAIRRLTGEERERARVVLLDVDLPGADGHQVLEALASEAVLEETRTIMMTAQADDDHVVDALARGAFDHIAKPFSVPVLVQRVLRALTA